MRPDEISLAIDWAAAEGWNPGLADAACFATVDPDGFLIGEIDGVPVATISCVNYDARFAFLGLYIVREDLRGRGYGLRIWNAAIAHAGPRVVGLDGVMAQQQNYRSRGSGSPMSTSATAAPFPCRMRRRLVSIALTEVPLTAVEAYDATVFPAPRSAFLRGWIGAPGHIGRALLRDGRLAAWGVIRPCRNGRKVGPLVADDRAAAEAVLSALLAARAAARSSSTSRASTATRSPLAQDFGLAPVFETARMYTGRSRRCGWIGSSASPPSSWASIFARAA